MNATHPEPRPANDQEREPSSSAGESARRRIAMPDLSEPARARIRLFIAESTAKGGASPADVAALYTSPEVVGDPAATTYLDLRFVQGQMPDDWRALQDALSDAQLDAPPGAGGQQLLDRINIRERAWHERRSIFDDPEDLEEREDATSALHDREPSLRDLDEWARRVIEQHIVHEVMAFGLPPAAAMQLRQDLESAGDERALQYLDIPSRSGVTPPDWEAIRLAALRVRSALEALGQDPSAAYQRVRSAHPELGAMDLLALLEP